MATKQKTQNTDGFTEAEKAAMKERAKELKKEQRANKKREEGEQDLLEKVAEMSKADRVMAEKIHQIVTTTVPDLFPKTWYGMPAYANEDNKVICFFKAASKFDERYATLGFDTMANLDDGNMWPTSFALTKLTEAEEKKITALVKQAIT